MLPRDITQNSHVVYRTRQLGEAGYSFADTFRLWRCLWRCNVTLTNSTTVTRLNICHWHLQLTDPLYRAFTGMFLEQRHLRPQPSVDRDVTVRWMQQTLAGRWGSATMRRMATGLLTCATAAGLCMPGTQGRPLTSPRVTDDALAYFLYLLRPLAFEGSLLENPYLASVGLTAGVLEQRLRRLPGLAFRRMGELWDFGWQYADLHAWAQHTLAPRQYEDDACKCCKRQL